ncbi:hypothetical protein ABDD95_06665 [Mucilaginibacter sp. PAMB04274]|uniref:hypothetical protein n=1 Tax=Mucilaginibacter sp. PAMB04274 TaxID=3138568 RepID=UPI0031F6CA14
MQNFTQSAGDTELIAAFLNGKSEQTLALFHYFVQQYARLGNIMLHPTKTMIAIGHPDKRVAWITQLGKNFIHVVFPFKEAYYDNLCFTKIGLVPGSTSQVNHHFRMYSTDDLTDEVLKFMRLSLEQH